MTRRSSGETQAPTTTRSTAS